MVSISTLITLMVVCVFITFILNYLLNKKSQNQLTDLFSWLLVSLLIWIVSLLLQTSLSNSFDISPIYFDYFTYIGICFLPVIFLLLSLSFAKTKINFQKSYLLLFIVPIISLLVLWTNDYHHLFYEVYSTDMSEAIAGPYFYIHSIYTYLLFFLGIINLLQYSIKNAGFFSKQSLLIIVGSLVPIVINVLGSFQVISMSIYVTPISFAIAITFYALAIFKFDFLKVAPIALQRIVDRMSDAYLVINEENKITDFNHTFLDIFNVTSNDIRNTNLLNLINKYQDLHIDLNALTKALEKTKKNNSTVTMDEHFDSIDKYFHIEINSIFNKGTFLGYLILLKDVTQHNVDMQTIKDNQDMLVEKERLASLGQMIGGIAHNLKTPIMSIAGATEGISDLVKEYDSSIEDTEVTIQDHHEIAHDMNEWLEKIKTHLSYMSDIITAIKGQAVAFSQQDASGFTVDELVKYINILMRHELKNSLINLVVNSDVDSSTEIKGNINSLVQVINNIISNAIQAYQLHNQTNVDIVLNLNLKNDKLIISIQDFAGGLPDKVQEKLFKEMITTKGKNGSGLGLFMSYSNIRAHFNGNMRYETRKNDGTTFFIEIPA